jgi:hypothetical protein
MELVITDTVMARSYSITPDHFQLLEIYHCLHDAVLASDQDISVSILFNPLYICHSVFPLFIIYLTQLRVYPANKIFFTLPPRPDLLWDPPSFISHGYRAVLRNLSTLAAH